MSSSINTAYNVTSSYKEYKHKLDSLTSPSDTTWIPGCDDFAYSRISSSKYDSANICKIAVGFLIHLKEKNIPSYEEEGCRYLYYWLHVKALENKNPIENTLDLYKKLNGTFNEENDGDNKFDKCIHQMNKDTCDKIQRIFSLHETFNIFVNQEPSDVAEKKCNSNCSELFSSYVNDCREIYDYDFCNELKNFREYHNSFVRNIRACQGDQYLLPPVEILDTRIIVAPFVLILVISLILPLLYKFTPFGPWIHQRIGKNKNMLNNIIEEEKHFIDNYEMKKDDSKKRYYKLLYNSS